MRTILVIDDASEIAELVQQCAPAYAIRNASDGIIGLDLLQVHHKEIDLVILDVNMPRLGGQATLLRIQALFPDIPVRIFSAFVTDRVRQLAVELTGKPPITKPVALERLQTEIAQSLGQTAAVQQSAVLQYAHDLVADLESQGRAAPLPTRILICGTNRVIQYGLRELIESTGMPFVYIHTSIEHINYFFREQEPIIVVTTYSDFQSSLLAPFPVFCLTFNLIEAIGALQHVKEIQTTTGQTKVFSLIVDVPGRSTEIAKHIRDGMQQLMQGRPYIPHQLAQLFFDPSQERPLSPDERELIRYELLQKDTKTIAALLRSTPEAVRQLRSRLAKKLGAPVEQWPDWAEQWWRSLFP